MSCRSTPGGSAASACATALSGGSADEVPEVMHRLRREHQSANPSAVTPTGEEAAQVIENLAMRVRHSTGLTDARRTRVLNKAYAAAEALRRGEKVPDAHTLHAWKNIDAELTPRPNARRTSPHPAVVGTDSAPEAPAAAPATESFATEAFREWVNDPYAPPTTPASVTSDVSQHSPTGPAASVSENPTVPDDVVDRLSGSAGGRRDLAPEGSCDYCDAIREFGNSDAPRHDPSATCASGGGEHCTCTECDG